MAVNPLYYGATTLVDLTQDTVTAETLAVGVTAHDKNGKPLVGTMSSSGSGGTSINGETGSYLARGDVTAGDFVQLTTWGVEEPKLDVAMSWTQNISNAALSAVAVLSSTQVIVVRIDVLGNSLSLGSEISNTYAQVVTFIDGECVPGESLLLVSENQVYPKITVERLTDNSAVILSTRGGSSGTSTGYMFVVDVSATGDITVVATDNTTTFYGDAGTYSHPPRIVVLTPKTFVVFGYYRGAYDYCAYGCSYENGTLTLTNRLAVVSGTSDEPPGSTYVAKLNENQVLLHSYDVSYYRVISFENQSITVKNTNLSDSASYYGKLIYWEDNVVFKAIYNRASSGTSTVYNPEFLTYDSLNNTLTKSEKLHSDRKLYYTFGAGKMSEDKACLLMASGTGTSATVYLGILDVVNKTIEYKEAIMTGMLSYSQYDLKRMDAHAGWVAVISGDTTEHLYLAPCVSETTAAPYFTRIDGVALSSASAGQNVTVVTPE